MNSFGTLNAAFRVHSFEVSLRSNRNFRAPLALSEFARVPGRRNVACRVGHPLSPMNGIFSMRSRAKAIFRRMSVAAPVRFRTIRACPTLRSAALVYVGANLPFEHDYER